MSSTSVTIRDLEGHDESLLNELAAMLVAEFRAHHPDAWPSVDAALKEVRQSLASNECGQRISRVAIAEEGHAVGWVGGIPSYGGRAWELHPLVVRHDTQRRGVGRALVSDLEEQARIRGGLTVWLGADDETRQTSLTGADLYGDLWRAVAEIRNLNDHPYEFYQKCGYTIVGVVPDANGLGKPDILMAKRIGADAR